MSQIHPVEWWQRIFFVLDLLDLLWCWQRIRFRSCYGCEVLNPFSHIIEQKRLSIGGHLPQFFVQELVQESSAVVDGTVIAVLRYDPQLLSADKPREYLFPSQFVTKRASFKNYRRLIVTKR
jgi:hypothetical protein